MTTSRGYFRLIIDGGHTGSAYCFMSGVFGTLDALSKAIAKDHQLTVFAIGDAPKLVLEGYLDGVRSFRVNLREHCYFSLSDGRELYGTAEGWSLDKTAPRAVLDEALIYEIAESIAEESLRATLRFAKTLPALPEHAPLAKTTRTVALHNGGTQPFGWDGDFFEGRSHRERLDKE